MKKYILLFCFLITYLFNSAQNVKYGGWNEQIVVGASATLNSTWLFNEAISSLDNGISDQEFSFGWDAGVSVEYRFNELLAVGLDLRYFSYQQKYSGALATQSNFWESSTTLNGINLPVYLKIMSRGGAFVEVGFQTGFITGARYSRSSVNGSIQVDNNDVSKAFSGFIVSPHLGFGVDFPVGEAFIITMGLRANYGINDIGGIDGLGNEIANYPNTNPGTPISPTGTSPSGTNALTAGIFLGVRYAFDAGGRY